MPGYIEIKELGRGASGRVVLAEHQATGMKVAIKYLAEHLRDDEDFVSAFRTEARILSEVESPQIARLYEYIEGPDGAAIVMELVDGVALRAMLREHGPTEPKSALVVLKGSLLGLAAAHERGVVHRDYKPENVLVNGEGQSKLADFGIAARTGRQGPHAGTPSYMAPEQWAGAPASPSTDIYAATATFSSAWRASRLPRPRRPAGPAPPARARADPDRDGARGRARAGPPRPGQGSRAAPQGRRHVPRELEAVAGAGYGPDWEEEGRSTLARRARAAGLLLFPLAAVQANATAIGTTILGMSKLKTLVIASGIAIAVGAGTVGSCIAFTPPPASGGRPVAIGTPISTFPASTTASSSPSASPTPPASISPTPPQKTSQPPPPVPPPPPATKVTAITVRVVQVFGAGPPHFRANLFVKTSGTKAVVITVKFFVTTGLRRGTPATPADIHGHPVGRDAVHEHPPCPRPADTRAPSCVVAGRTHTTCTHEQRLVPAARLTRVSCHADWGDA